MNFLNQAEKTAKKVITANGGNRPMTNPFKNNTVPTAPSAHETAPATASHPTIPGVKPNALPKPPARPGAVGTKPAIPGKPGIPAKPGTIPTKPAAPTKPVAPVAETQEEVKTAITPVVEATTPVKAPEDKKEVKEEVKVETKTEVKEEVKAEEPKTTKKGGTKRKTAAKKKEETAPATTETIATEIENVEIPKTDVSYAEAVQAIKSDFVDEEWNEFRNKAEETMAGIIIDSGMNKAQVSDLLSQISVFRDEVSIAYTDTKTLYESLTAKDDGLIDRVKRLNAKGSNAEERKITGTIAAMNYKEPRTGNNINLFELLDETRSRYNFLKNIMETIEFKKAVLLTMLSSFKNEK